MLSLSSQMGRGRKTAMKQRGNQALQKRIMDSEDSDEDYVAEADEVDEQSDDLDSLVGDVLVEESCFEEEEERDERKGGWRTVVKSKQRAQKGVSKSRKNGLSRPKKRRKVVRDSDDDSDDEFKPDECEYLEEEEEEAEEVEYDEEEVAVEEDDDEDEEEEEVLEEEDEAEEEEDIEEEKEEEEEEEEEEDEDDKDEGEGGWRTVVKPRTRKGSPKSRKSVINRSKKRRKGVYDDSDDSDDVEFAPDEFERLEYDDEEEDDDDEKRLSKAKSKTKKRRTTSKRKTSVRRAGGTVRKPSKKGSAVRNQRKGKRGIRKKRATVDSDLDICSDSSDHEFTISEEEREQVREADLFCRAVATNLRSSRKIQENEPFCKPNNKPPARKGKEKAEETRNDVGKPVCGICLTEEGKNSVRGTLNCCTHYFCFACIMEWSKVETRCPLCKQRFVTISKATKCNKGFDQKKTVVTVPERDQVYQPSEEELRDFLNPYENVICTECHQGGDDALMLLCDVCDSPAHTYCVGLGREVPEGNWYCDGCRPAVIASSQPQMHGLTADQRVGASASDRQTYENMSEIDLNVTIPETPLSQGDGLLSSPRFSGGGLQLPSPGSGIGVSTVSGRRRIHRQIHYILSNRMSQTGGEISSLGNLIGFGVNTAFHHGRTHVGTSHSAQQFGRYNENYPHSMQNMDSNMTGQIADGLSHDHRGWSGLDSIHLEATHSQLPARGTLQPCTSRSSMGPHIGGLSSENRVDERDHRVKQEVHCIVENQLRSMSRFVNLGDNIYMEISRRSEHTIMAAYGLEPRRQDTFEVQPRFCTHLLDMLANTEASPINDCCIDCFQDFVKVVVKKFVDVLMAPHWQDLRF